MTKAWCLWCELGQGVPRNDMYWIHEKCFIEITDMARNIETIEQYLKGELPRISKNGNRIGYETVELFLIEMTDFNRRANNIMELIKKIRKSPTKETEK